MFHILAYSANLHLNKSLNELFQREAVLAESKILYQYVNPVVAPSQMFVVCVYS